MSLINSLNRRYATKAFDPTKKISASDLDILLESLRLAPSSFGLEPWKFVVVTNPELRTILREHSRGQSQVTDASHLIVLCAKNDMTETYIQSWLAHAAQVKGVDLSSLDGYRKMLMGFAQNHTADSIKIRADKQVYIAQGFLLMAAAQMQIDACPMEGFDRAAYDKLLELEGTDYHSVVVVPVGYRAADDKYATAPKVRWSREQVVEWRE